MLMLLRTYISENKNSMAIITQNRWIALFSLWSFNQSEAGKKRRRNICLMERKIFFMIAKTLSNPPIFHKYGLEWYSDSSVSSHVWKHSNFLLSSKFLKFCSK